MSEFVRLIFAVLSTASLCTLSLYIFLAVRGKSELLYSTVSSRLVPSWKDKAFFALATIGFLVCMFKGAEAMLYWMPSSWGSADSDGDYQTLKSYIAFLFAGIGGIALVGFIDKATHEKFHLRELAEFSLGQEKIINASRSPASLNSLRKEFETAIEEIRADLAKRTVPEEWGLLPGGRRIRMYRELIGVLDSMEKKSGHV